MKKTQAPFKIVVVIALLLVTLSLSISLLNLSVSLKSKQTELITRSLPLSVENIYTEIQRHIIEPNLISSMMAHDTFVKDWLLNEEESHEKIRRYLRVIQEKYGLFLAFLVSEKTQKYYSQNGFVEFLNTQDPDNQWYYRFKNSPVNHEINLDHNDRFGTGLILFINHKIFNEDKTLLGATGIGMNVAYIDNIFKRFRENYQFTVFFINRDGKVILKEQHKNSLEKLSDNPSLNALRNQIFENTQGVITYKDNGDKYLLKTRYIKELDAYLIVQAKLGDFTAEVKNTFYVNLAISLIITLAITLVIVETLRRFNRRLHFLAQNDSLTRLKNRRSFNEILERFLALSKRHHQPLSLIFFDVDNFKTINDNFGHSTGDEVLVRLADIMRNSFRTSDLISRWGGEEFIIALPETDFADAMLRAEKLRKNVMNDTVLKTLVNGPVTISLGVTYTQLSDTPQAMFQRLDRALYQAKHNGKNQVVSI